MKLTSHFLVALVSVFALCISAKVTAQNYGKWTTTTSSSVGIGMTPSLTYALRVANGAGEDFGYFGGIYVQGDFALHAIATVGSGISIGSVAIRAEGGNFGVGGWFSGAIAGKFDGNVQIYNGKLTAERIDVEEMIYAKEITVKLPPFPDYVFDGAYELMPLKKLEAYIEANKRLPNMPSADEIEKNGGNIGELQVKQMEKIEELTLYILEMNKRLEKLEEENMQMKEEVLLLGQAKK